MTRVLVIVHDRSLIWYRRLRGRIADSTPRWVATETADDLDRALELSTAPVVVIALGEPLGDGLHDVARVASRTPEALILVIDPFDRLGVGSLARELGATLTVGRETTPPTVAETVGRWIELAARRSRSTGWSPTVEPDPDTWEAWLATLLKSTPDPPHDDPPRSRTEPDARP